MDTRIVGPRSGVSAGRWCTLLLLVWLPLLAGACGDKQESPSVSLKPYRNPVYRYSIAYPAGLMLLEKEWHDEAGRVTGVRFVYVNQPESNAILTVQITQHREPTEPTVESETRLAEWLYNGTDMKIISIEPVTVGGLHGVKTFSRYGGALDNTQFRLARGRLEFLVSLQQPFEPWNDNYELELA